MIKCLIDRIKEKNSEANRNELFNFVMKNKLSDEDTKYLADCFERLKSTTDPYDNYARTALILGSKPLIITGIKQTAAPIDDDTIDDCVYNLISIIDNFDSSKGANYSTFVVNNTKYYLLRQYNRVTKDDAMNEVSVWLDQKVKDDSNTEMHNMIAGDDAFYEEEIDGLSQKEKFVLEVESVQKYLKYLTPDEQYVFIIVNGLYNTQMSIKILSKELNVRYSYLEGIYNSAKNKLLNLFTSEKTEEQQKYYEKYKDLNASVLQPEDLPNYILSYIKNKPHKKASSRRSMAFYAEQQKVKKLFQTNQIIYYNLTITEKQILELYYGINTEDLTSRQVADKLNLTLTCVTTHLGNIKRKLSKEISEINSDLGNETIVKNLLEKHPNNIYLIPEEFHNLMRKYYGIGEPAVDFEKLCLQQGKNATEISKMISDWSHTLVGYSRKFESLQIEDIESFILEKNIDINNIFSLLQVRIFKKFYGIGQPKIDIDEIARDFRIYKNTILKNLNSINFKLNSYIEGYLEPSCYIPNKAIDEIIVHCNIFIEDILTEQELKVMKVFLSPEYRDVKDIGKVLKITSYKSHKILFSAISKVVQVYNDSVKKEDVSRLNFKEFNNDSRSQFIFNEDVSLSEEQKIILSLFLGFDGKPLSAEEIANKLNIDQVRVINNLYRIRRIVFNRFRGISNGDIAKLMDEIDIVTSGFDKSVWSDKQFLNSLPLEKILSKYEIEIFSLRMGLSGEVKNINEISKIIKKAPNLISTTISVSKKKIKEYMQINQISYINNSLIGSAKKPEIEENFVENNEVAVEERKKKRSIIWWNYEFVSKLPLKEILTPHQYRIASMKLGLDGVQAKTIAQIAKELEMNAGSVESVIHTARQKVKKYCAINGISYVTEAGMQEIFKPLKEDKKIDKRTLVWWNYEFVSKLPLNEILTPYQYRIISMRFGLNSDGAQAKTISQISNELTIKANAVNAIIHTARQKIKKYCAINGISYVTEAGMQETFKPLKEDKKIDKRTLVWWNYEFVSKFPLDKILTPHQYQIISMRFGLDSDGAQAKTVAQIADELKMNKITVNSNINFARQKIKEYCAINGISYVTEAGVVETFKPAKCIQKQTNQTESSNEEAQNAEDNQFGT